MNWMKIMGEKEKKNDFKTFWHGEQERWSGLSLTERKRLWEKQEVQEVWRGRRVIEEFHFRHVELGTCIRYPTEDRKLREV